ncbi:BgTH12-01817 [Blumeria graminis f. sp. triticale]|uniref:BgTH12-01817 n=1 Tax=Blumeria graminis f. sp. triticale TaxID=1689686 RepID=A0A9W4DKM2_BLUGR|nr:BgTH12-01817 [Blumeria graminis f. sp. triticale]
MVQRAVKLMDRSRTGPSCRGWIAESIRQINFQVSYTSLLCD